MPYQNHIKSIYGPYMGHPSSQNWTLDFEPAFSPRFSPTLSPRSIFHIAQRFPILKHVTSGSHEPAILFSHWSAVSPTGNDMTSSSGHVIALDQSGASIWAIRAHLTTNNIKQLSCLSNSALLFQRQKLTFRDTFFTSFISTRLKLIL